MTFHLSPPPSLHTSHSFLTARQITTHIQLVFIAMAEGSSVVRTFDEEMKYIHRETPTRFRIDKGCVPNMRVEGAFYVNSKLEQLMFDELKQHITAGGVGGFLPAVKQIANVAALPGIVGRVRRRGMEGGKEGRKNKGREVRRGICKWILYPANFISF